MTFLERICAMTWLCKKQGEIDALKEGIADISSPMKSTAAASLKRSLILKWLRLARNCPK